MSVLVEYFAAPDDTRAAETIDWPGDVAAGVPRRGLRRARPGLPAFDAPDLEPLIVLGALEELLTGRTFEQQTSDPTCREIVAERDDGERLVVRIDPPFVTAVVAAPPERLQSLVPRWQQIEEFWGQMDAEPLLAFVADFQRLCADAGARGDGVYCRVVV